MFTEFRLCGIGMVTIKPILCYYSKFNFYTGKLGEFNDCMADDLIA